MSKFWKMNKVKNAAELILYGEISDVSWWGDEVTPKQMSDELKAMGNVDEITVRINSGGGDVFAGVAIHSMLKRHTATVTVYIDGLAASIASIIAMAGDKIIMPKGSMMMIHNPWSWGMGESKDFRKLADDLDTIRGAMLEIYTAKTGMKDDEVLALLDAETWLTATEAVKQGFATEIEDNSIAASVRGKKAIFNGIEMDWSKFVNAPNLPESTPAETEDDEDGAPMFDVGDSVAITIPPRVEGHSTGEVREALLTYSYGILFDGQEDVGIYHWYTESELKEQADAPDPVIDQTTNNSQQHMKTRNLDLEMKSLSLIDKTN
jgi:ATP-dependent Clp protease protease subunit